MVLRELREGQSGRPVDNPTDSYWHTEPSEKLLGHRTTPELPKFADVVIIGSGITGAFAAHFLLNGPDTIVPGAEPSSEDVKPLKVLMLEAREACRGATGRNGGHCQPHVFSSPPSTALFELANFSFLRAFVQLHSIPCDFRVLPLGGVAELTSPEAFALAKEMVAELQATHPSLAALVRCVGCEEVEELERLKVNVAGLNGGGVCVQRWAASCWPYKLVCGVLEGLLERHGVRDRDLKEKGFNLQTNTPVTGVRKVFPPPEEKDRWAAIREGAAERAAQTKATAAEDKDTSAEETIESRVARIKARIAELTGESNKADGNKEPSPVPVPASSNPVTTQDSSTPSSTATSGAENASQPWEEWDNQSPLWEVRTGRGIIRCRQVLLATNGYTSHLLPAFADLIVPVRGQVAALVPPVGSKEETPVKLDASYVMDGPSTNREEARRGEYLVQRPSESDGLLIFGGGRYQAEGLELGVWKDDVIDEKVAAYLRRALPQLVDVHRDAAAGEAGTKEESELGHATKEDQGELKAHMEWTGIMGYSRDREPWVGEVPRSLGGADGGLFICAGYTGHGMPAATLCARDVARHMLYGKEAAPKRDAWQGQVDGYMLPALWKRCEDGPMPESFRVSEERAARARAANDGVAVGGMLGRMEALLDKKRDDVVGGAGRTKMTPT